MQRSSHGITKLSTDLIRIDLICIVNFVGRPTLSHDSTPARSRLGGARYLVGAERHRRNYSEQDFPLVRTRRGTSPAQECFFLRPFRTMLRTRYLAGAAYNTSEQDFPPARTRLGIAHLRRGAPPQLLRARLLSPPSVQNPAPHAIPRWRRLQLLRAGLSPSQISTRYRAPSSIRSEPCSTRDTSPAARRCNYSEQECSFLQPARTLLCTQYLTGAACNYS